MALPQIHEPVHEPEEDVFSRQLNEIKPSKRGRAWKSLGVGVVVLAVGAAGFLNFTKSGNEIGKMGSQAVTGAITYKTNPDLIFNNLGSHVNILLIGRDVNWKIGKVFDPKTGKYRPYQVHDESAKARSDTMIVVSLNKENNTIRMVSFPRDAIVRLADNDYGVRRTKLNAAHAYGGPELLIKTLHDELGLTIHRYAVIKFDGFKSLIDRVGGVEVNVEGALKRDRKTGKLYRGNLDYDDNWGNLHIHLKPGLQRLDGDTAHAYVRFRMDREGDPGRIRRQQQVMRALAKQMAHVPFWRLPGLIDDLQKQFHTDMKTDEMASAAAFAKNIGDTSKIQPLTLFGTYSERGSIHLNKPKNEKLLSYIFGPTFNAEKFLNRSPWTRGDDIGPSAENNPGALAILKQAGLIDGEESGSSGSQIPVRVEENDARVGERSTRVAAVSSEPAETPRRSRRARENRESESRRERATPRESVPVAAPSEVIGGPTAREESGASLEVAPVPQPPVVEHSAELAPQPESAP